VPLGEEIPLERGHQRGVTPHPLRNRYFTSIGSSSVKTVADRHSIAAYHNNTADELSGGANIDDLELP